MADDEASESPETDRLTEITGETVINTNVFFGDNQTVFQGSGQILGSHWADSDNKDAHTNSRQAFLSNFYKQALRQADITFRMSLIFMSIGAIIVLTGGVLAIMRLGGFGSGNPALLTALSGAIIGSCGGAFAVHANRARKHLTRQAEKMEKDLQSDRKLEQTLRLIGEVEDATLRDRLKSVTAMRVLDLEPDAESVTSHLLTSEGENRRQINPGADKG